MVPAEPEFVDHTLSISPYLASDEANTVDIIRGPEEIIKGKADPRLSLSQSTTFAGFVQEFKEKGPKSLFANK